MFGYLGPNGAGKTTTIRTMLDFIRPTAGRIRCSAWTRAATASGVHARIGYLPGEFGLYERLTGAEYLEYFAALRGGVPSDRRSTDLAERLELDLVGDDQVALARQQAEGRL